MLEDAIAHASAAGDGRLAARLVHEGNVDLLVGGRYASTRQLIDAIPPERGEFGPFCDALYALSLMHDGAEPMLVYERFEALRGMRAAPGVARTVDQARIWPFFGRIREAVEEGRLAYERYRDEPPAIYHSIAAHLGLTLVFAGEPDSARAVLERHLDAMVYRNSKSWALAALAFCAVEERDGETAEHYAREAVAIAVERGAETAFQFAIAYQALGDVLRFQGRHVEADEALTHAHHVTRRHRGSLQHALTLILHAELRLAQGDRRRARQCATTARSVVDRYPDPGAFAGRLAAVEAMLDRRAHDVLRGSRPTPTELRVLEMLSGDLTLQAIAGELYVSIHTVKSHTQRLYRRLGVRTRADAVAVAYERGLL